MSASRVGEVVAVVASTPGRGDAMNRVLVGSAILLLLPAAAAAQDPETKQALQQLTQRIDELEEQQLKTADRVGGRAMFQAYTANSVDLGGHVTSVFTAMSGEGSTEVGHLVTLLELYLKARIDDHWSLFAAPAFYTFNGGLTDDPVTTTIVGDPVFTASETTLTDVFLSRAQAEYGFDDRLQLQAGLIGTPHGTTIREYYIPSRFVVAGNLHTRYFLGNQVFPQQLFGARASGKAALGDAQRLEYDAYFGSEDDSPADGIGGARLAFVTGANDVSIAANWGRGTREGFPPAPLTDPFPLYTANVPFLQAPFPAQFNLTRDYEFAGIDVEWRTGPLLLRTEAYYSAERDVADQRAFSQEVNWFVADDVTLTYRFDYHDAGADLDPFGTAVRPLGHATEHVAGVCWSPNAGVRLRLDVHHQLLPNSDETVQFVNVSWSLSF
jgi:hypothetical protein